MTARRGSILIIVSGLAMLVLSLTIGYVVVVRADTADVKSVVRDAQARAMLAAALSYVAETSRIGWSTVGAQAPDAQPNRFASETMGWNDVRNGAIGPIPREVLAGGAVDADPQLAGFVAATGDCAHRVGRGSGRWPEPGTTVRQSMYAWERPPYAVALAHNPVVFHQRAEDVPASGGWYFKDYAHANRDVWSLRLPVPDGEAAKTGSNLHSYVNGAWAGRLWRFSAQPRPDPRPVADTLEAWNAGDPTPRAGGRAAWFRVYRETPADHDGDGEPWYDTVNLNGDGRVPPNASVFVVTCGTGGSMGFRDWDEAVAGLGAAGAQAVFGNAAAFWDLRREEVVLWYRAEWTAYTQQNRAPLGAFSFPETAVINQNPSAQRSGPDQANAFATRSDGGYVTHYQRQVGMASPHPFLPFGSFRWIQALDREPPRW